MWLVSNEEGKISGNEVTEVTTRGSCKPQEGLWSKMSESFAGFRIREGCDTLEGSL